MLSLLRHSLTTEWPRWVPIGLLLLALGIYLLCDASAFAHALLLLGSGAVIGQWLDDLARHGRRQEP